MNKCPEAALCTDCRVVGVKCLINEDKLSQDILHTLVAYLCMYRVIGPLGQAVYLPLQEHNTG